MFDPAECKQLLIYGGSFDPPHHGHIALPAAVAAMVGADGILYIPAGDPPHKTRNITPAPHRLAMLKLALEDQDNAAICTYELDRPGKSYTVDTLEHLRQSLGPDVTMRLLIGADMAAMFDQWHAPDRIISLAEPLVMMRAPFDVDALLEKQADRRWRQRIVQIPTMDISSTRIRRLIAEGDDGDGHLALALDEKVLQYIRHHGLYQVF